MSKRFLSIVTMSFCTAGILFFQPVAHAETKLTEATVQNFRNQVRLMLQGKSPRDAQRGNKMQPGDALTTAPKSWAELRFNDRSLARVGERALFQFLPNTRTFYLGNGTALLLIPPGQGRSRVQTPNGAAGIRGSALFVRYSPDTDTTLIGALTNSQIEVYNKGNSQAVPLQAGQMAVIVQDQIRQVFNFDLRRFYETSPMVQGLNLTRQSTEANPDQAVPQEVQAETAEAVKSQVPLKGTDVVQNPGWIGLNSLSRDPYNNPGAVLGTAQQTLPPIALPGIDRNLPDYQQITTGSEAIRDWQQRGGGQKPLDKPADPLPSGLPIVSGPTSPVDTGSQRPSGGPTKPPVPDRPTPDRPTPSPIDPKPQPPPIDPGTPTPVPTPPGPPASPPPSPPSPPGTPPPSYPTPTPAPAPTPPPASNPAPTPTPPVTQPPRPTPTPEGSNALPNPNQVPSPPAPVVQPPAAPPAVSLPSPAPGANALPNPNSISTPVQTPVSIPTSTPAASPAPVVTPVTPTPTLPTSPATQPSTPASITTPVTTPTVIEAPAATPVPPTPVTPTPVTPTPATETQSPASSTTPTQTQTPANGTASP